jgi:SPASM domain peptide maturase of grasp-with-spasm system
MKPKTCKRFEDCIPVRGYFRSIIMDITRKTYEFIPNMLCDAIATNKLIDNKLPQEYIEFLNDNEFIFECKENELTFYPPLNNQWDYPATITNTILEIGEHHYFTKEFLEKIIDLGCRHFVFIFTEPVTIQYLANISKLFDETPVFTIDIYCKYSKDFKNEDFENILTQNTRITYILLYESPHDEIIALQNIRGNIIYYSKSVSYTECSVNFEHLQVNMPLYTESLHYNTFYNRKLCIEKNGNIKNYFTQKKSFGNIFSDNVEEVISKKPFQKIWKIRKDVIDTCKACEFRYMCVDSRIPKLSGNSSYYHTQECAYNPYICKWKNEEGYIPVSECGTYTKETGFILDKEKVEELNKQLWGEDNE